MYLVLIESFQTLIKKYNNYIKLWLYYTFTIKSWLWLHFLFQSTIVKSNVLWHFTSFDYYFSLFLMEKNSTVLLANVQKIFPKIDSRQHFRVRIIFELAWWFILPRTFYRHFEVLFLWSISDYIVTYLLFQTTTQGLSCNHQRMETILTQIS